MRFTGNYENGIRGWIDPTQAVHWTGFFACRVGVPGARLSHSDQWQQRVCDETCFNLRCAIGNVKAIVK